MEKSSARFEGSTYTRKYTSPNKFFSMGNICHGSALSSYFRNLTFLAHFQNTKMDLYKIYLLTLRRDDKTIQLTTWVWTRLSRWYYSSCSPSCESATSRIPLLIIFQEYLASVSPGPHVTSTLSDTKKQKLMNCILTISSYDFYASMQSLKIITWEFLKQKMLPLSI